MDSLDIANREILWNVDALGNQVLMYLLLAISLFCAGIGILRHVELVASGKPSPEHNGRWLRRTLDLISWALLQKGVLQSAGPALAHTLIYAGFLVLLFTTTMVLIDHDLGFHIYHGRFYLAVTILSDVFGLGVLIGCALAAHRRYIQGADLLHNRAADSLVLGAIALLVAQGFFLEGLRIHVTEDQWAAYSPVGNAVALFLWGIDGEIAASLHFYTWWFHTITVFALIALFPYSKFFHILAATFNLFFRYAGLARGSLKSPGDINSLMESGAEFNIGLGTIKDYTWKHLLDLEACTSCGRCQNACPAYRSGKPLSPKWLILDTRNHAISLHAQGKLTDKSAAILPEPLRKFDASMMESFFLPSSGLSMDAGAYSSEGKFRAANKAVQTASLAVGKSVAARIAGEVLDSDVFWSCTTCMACVEACPVGINHVEQIIENRRNMVLMQGEIPAEAQTALRALENRANPYGPPAERIKWLGDLNVRILKPGDSVDYLYWVGCVSAYDPRKQKIARALVKLMSHAGLSFGILGTAEGCSGDPARRLGEENLYQTLAKKNLEVLRGITFKTIVANCPHCFNTIKNEYPQFGNLAEGKKVEVIHHSALLRKLAAENKLQLGDSADSITFHDPCYLGRYNSEYDAPRDSLKSIKSLRIIEMEESRENALCCGAGGGHFWMDMKKGERINVLRVNQAAATGASCVATGCPFCMQMIEDGIKLTNREETLKVKDIAEVLAERLA